MDLYSPPNLIDCHHNMIYEPYRLLPITLTNVNIETHVKDYHTLATRLTLRVTYMNHVPQMYITIIPTQSFSSTIYLL